MSGPIIIVGGGLAGLFCALKLAPTPVTVLAAAPIGEGASSAWAQGGIAAAMAEGDTPQSHTADTVLAGGGIVDEAIMLGMAREASERVHDLLSFGVPFDKDLSGKLVQSREAAHSTNRIVRVRGDMAGKAIMEALVAAVWQTPSITVRENIIAERLVTENGRVAGIVARGERGGAEQAVLFRAANIVLATGGIGYLYAVTTNPPESCGTGVAIAAEAGAVIADPEFVQFHPTAIAIGRDPAPLATEALRGEGATLINRDGARFMTALHPDAELAPRDIVARGVFNEIAAGRGAFLDCRAAVGASFAAHFPTVYATCRSAGIDPVTQPIPIAPAEHYHMGGVATDAEGRTSLPGLWAAGEVASTGVHGANRLASNSLLEAIVFAARIAGALRNGADVAKPVGWGEARAEPDESQAIARLRAIMAAKVGVVRTARGLSEAIAAITALADQAHGTTLRAMTTTALLVATAALQREESRGAHFRPDYPTPSPDWAHRTMITLDEARAIAASVAREASP
jgi:L-aspartate oxidase